MNTTELIVSIVVGIGCCALGMFLGSMPLKREQITEEQNKYQQLGGLLACGLVVILMLLSMDIASWVAIAALAVGVGICRVPAVRRWLLAQFPCSSRPNRSRRCAKRSRRSADRRISASSMSVPPR